MTEKPVIISESPDYKVVEVFSDFLEKHAQMQEQHDADELIFKENSIDFDPNFVLKKPSPATVGTADPFLDKVEILLDNWAEETVGEVRKYIAISYFKSNILKLALPQQEPPVNEVQRFVETVHVAANRLINDSTEYSADTGASPAVSGRTRDFDTDSVTTKNDGSLGSAKKVSKATKASKDDGTDTVIESCPAKGCPYTCSAAEKNNEGAMHMVDSHSDLLASLSTKESNRLLKSWGRNMPKYVDSYRLFLQMKALNDELGIKQVRGGLWRLWSESENELELNFEVLTQEAE